MHTTIATALLDHIKVKCLLGEFILFLLIFILIILLEPEVLLVDKKNGISCMQFAK